MQLQPCPMACYICSLVLFWQSWAGHHFAVMVPLMCPPNMTLMMVFCLVPYRSMVETWLLAKVWHTPLCLVQILCAGPMSSYCSEPLICFSMWCVDSTDSWWLWWLDFIRIFFAILAADLPSLFPWLYRVVILLWWIHIHKRNMSIHGCQTVEIICYVFIWNSPLSKISFQASYDDWRGRCIL